MRYDLSRLRVLVVDDSSFMTRIMSTMLSALKIKDITIARTAAEALEHLYSSRYDVIFTDWEMGIHANGGAVLKHVRRSASSLDPYAIVIAISAHTDVTRIQMMLAAGVDDVLVKPVSAENIYRRVIRAIENPGQFVRTPDYFGPARNLERVPALMHARAEI